MRLNNMMVILLALCMALFTSCGGGGGGSDDAVNETFTISYNANGAESGSVPASQNGSTDKSASIQDNTGNLAKAGYLFDGWNTASDGSGKTYTPGTKYTGSNLKLYAKWAAIYKVQDMGISPAPALNGVQKASGASNLKILGLTEKGKTLTVIDIPAAIDGNTIKAIGTGAFQGCSFIKALTLPDTVTTIEGNAFSGCTGITSVIIPASVDTIGDGAFSGCSNLTKLAFVTAAPPANMGSGILDGTTADIQVPAGAEGSYSGVPGLAGHSVEGSYTVTFDSDGGSSVATQVVTDGEKAQEPADPTRAGYEFAGWYKGAVLFDFNTLITENITLTAHWNQIITYTVTFSSAGGSSVASQQVREGLTATEPTPAPTKAGYDFTGWYKDGNPFNFSTPITENITLVAQWVPAGFVKVKGGTVSGQIADSHIFIAGRTVNIRDMYVCIHEVTQKEFKQYMKLYVWNSDIGAGHSKESQFTAGMGDNYPVFWTTWYSAVMYCNLRSVAEGLTPCYYIHINDKDETDVAKWLTALGPNLQRANDDYQCFNCEGGKYYYNGTSTLGNSQTLLNYLGSNDLDGGIRFNTSANGYRLPTEVEWEYIARGGNNGIPSTQYTYSGSNEPDGYVVGDGHVCVGDMIKTKLPNALGIYDMSGNAYEWVWDWHIGDVYITSSTFGRRSG